VADTITKEGGRNPTVRYAARRQRCYASPAHTPTAACSRHATKILASRALYALLTRKMVVENARSRNRHGGEQADIVEEADQLQTSTKRWMRRWMHRFGEKVSDMKQYTVRHRTSSRHLLTEPRFAEQVNVKEVQLHLSLHKRPAQQAVAATALASAVRTSRARHCFRRRPAWRLFTPKRSS